MARQLCFRRWLTIYLLFFYNAFAKPNMKQILKLADHPILLAGHLIVCDELGSITAEKYLRE